MKNNKYRINYKNGNSLMVEAISMRIENGKLYQAKTHYPFSNVCQSVLSADKIESIECVEKNNEFGEEK